MTTTSTPIFHSRDPAREFGSFPLQYEGRDDPEDLIKTGKYDWVADYSRQIVHSNAASVVSEAGIEIVLLSPPAGARQRPKAEWAVSMQPDIDLEDVFRKYDRPTIWDVLKFGALYPDKQRSACILFPHEPWKGPHGPSSILVLRSDLNGARGLSYVVSLGAWLAPWWWDPLVAVRRRRGPHAVPQA